MWPSAISAHISLASSCAASLAYAPTNVLALEGCKRRGLSATSASDALGALVNVAYTVGALVGPLLGGALVELFGFRWASCAFGLALAAVFPALLPCLCEGACAREPPSEAVAALATNLVVAATAEGSRSIQEPIESSSCSSSKPRAAYT